MQKISQIEEIKATNQAPRWENAKPGIYSNTLWSDSNPAHVTVLLYDVINTPYLKQQFVRDSLGRFLSALPETSDPIMLAALTTNGLRIIHPFTRDPSQLRQAVMRLKSKPSDADRVAELTRSKDEAAQAALAAVSARSGGNASPDDPEIERLRALFQDLPDSVAQRRDLNRTELTLLLLSQLAHSLAGVPGRKSLLWATGGIVYAYGDEPPNGFKSPSQTIGQHKTDGIPQTQAAEVNDLFELAWRILSDSNIAVYPIDLMELENPGYTDVSSQQSQVVRLISSKGFGLRSQAMTSFPDRTGGRYCPLQSRLENCFRSAMEDSSQYYMVAYYPLEKTKPGWRKLKVHVTSPDVKVHARSGYYFRSSSASPQSRQVEVAQALVSPLDATGISLAMHWTNTSALPLKRTFELFVDPQAITIDPENSNHFKFTITSATRNEKGELTGNLAKSLEGHLTTGDLKKILTRGFVYRDELAIPAESADFRLVVRDELSGRIGSVTASLSQ